MIIEKNKIGLYDQELVIYENTASVTTDTDAISLNLMPYKGLYNVTALATGSGETYGVKLQEYDGSSWNDIDGASHSITATGETVFLFENTYNEIRARLVLSTVGSESITLSIVVTPV